MKIRTKRAFKPALPPKPKWAPGFTRPPRERTWVEYLGGIWPNIHLSPTAHGKMWALVQECDTEVGWLSPCRKLENGDILVEDVLVPRQTCTVVTTDITSDGEAELLQELLAANQRDVISRLACWGHSHVDMPVFPSMTDEEQTQSFLRRHAKRNAEFFLRLIANRHGDLHTTAYLLHRNAIVHQPNLCAEPPSPELWKAWAQREIKEKVRKVRFSAALARSGNIKIDFEDFNRATFKRWAAQGLIDPDDYDYDFVERHEAMIGENG
jgi:hypothetical protein